MYYLRSYPLSLLTAAAICYLSFFTPPQTDMDGIPNIDKIVHICMYGGLSTLLWIEYLFRHPSIRRGRATAGCIVLPILMSGTIELGHLYGKQKRRLAGLCRQLHGSRPGFPAGILSVEAALPETLQQERESIRQNAAEAHREKNQTLHASATRTN